VGRQILISSRAETFEESMASGLVIHIESGRDRHTQVLSQERIRVGSGADCDLRLRSSVLPADTPFVFELERSNGHYVVSQFEPTLALTHNGAPLAAGAVVEDGDELRVADTDLALRFFPVRELPAVVRSRRGGDVQVAPFIENAAVEAAATARRDDAKVFLREFTRELIREINTSTKIIVLLLVVALVGGILYLGFAAYKELQNSRALINKQNEQLTRMQAGMSEQNKLFEQVDKANKDILYSQSLAPKLRGEFGNGVCLISGTYVLVEPGTGRPLRYPERKFDDTETATEGESAEQQQLLTPEGNGEIFEKDFSGTGFHVGDGFILTNKHLAVSPWEANEAVQALGSSVGGQFRIKRMVAFFPEHKQSFVIRFKQAAPRDDVAVCAFDVREMPTDIPALPIDPDAEAATIGKKVVFMGYPSGEERILASLPENEAREIQQRYGRTLGTLLNALAERNFIKPLLTQGSIIALESHRILFDAGSAEGGSGAPLFGQSGKVIGVNFGTFVQMPNVNFAVPIKFAVPILERAGWKRPAPPGDINAASTPKDARVVSSASNPVR
jgi:S1-C subfamily serine protease